MMLMTACCLPDSVSCAACAAETGGFLCNDLTILGGSGSPALCGPARLPSSPALPAASADWPELLQQSPEKHEPETLYSTNTLKVQELILETFVCTFSTVQIHQGRTLQGNNDKSFTYQPASHLTYCTHNIYKNRPRPQKRLGS